MCSRLSVSSAFREALPSEIKGPAPAKSQKAKGKNGAHHHLMVCAEGEQALRQKSRSII
jgi:hypothetical protein